MNHKHRNEEFLKFREQHPSFTYRNFHLLETRNSLDLSFQFFIDGTTEFNPSLSFPKPIGGWKIDPVGSTAKKIAFCVGMAEAVSYWKVYCPPTFYVKAGELCETEQSWWQNLYYLGLGEFFYVNQIDTESSSILKFVSDKDTQKLPISLERTGKKLIPVGGGKDSLVSLEVLRSERSSSSILLMNAPHSAKEGALSAGYLPEQIIEIKRHLDSRLFELNNRHDASRALNGHTPFSALLAFVSLFAAALTGSEFIVLSNESSANEPTVHNSHVNHQYSKSAAFERDFREYVAGFITPDISYFSLLRPVNELQIASILSAHPQYFPIFKSCNVGSRQGVWCGKCAKCLFSFLMLEPFVESHTMVSIFGQDLLDDEFQLSHMRDLLGLSIAKPFDCVGTVEEVRAAISLILAKPTASQTPRRLLDRIKSENPEMILSPDAARTALREWNTEHFIPPPFESYLKDALNFQQ